METQKTIILKSVEIISTFPYYELYVMKKILNCNVTLNFFSHNVLIELFSLTVRVVFKTLLIINYISLYNVMFISYLMKELYIFSIGSLRTVRLFNFYNNELATIYFIT